MKSVILCVDDDPLLLLSLKIELRNSFQDRFSYETAESGNDALYTIEHLVKENVEIVLIVSDYIMPGMKGDELLSTVKERFPGITAIMLTGQMDADLKKDVVEKGLAKMVISKPWERNFLKEIIKDICNQCND